MAALLVVPPDFIAPADFVKAVEEDGEWDLIARTDGSVIRSVKARDLWNKIADAAWKCADPGVHYDTTINEWHTSPEGGRIRASNPCSEYLFLWVFSFQAKH